jgi:hypothetical protein
VTAHNFFCFPPFIVGYPICICGARKNNYGSSLSCDEVLEKNRSHKFVEVHYGYICAECGIKLYNILDAPKISVWCEEPLSCDEAIIRNIIE